MTAGTVQLLAKCPSFYISRIISSCPCARVSVILLQKTWEYLISRQS